MHFTKMGETWRIQVWEDRSGFVLTVKGAYSYACCDLNSEMVIDREEKLRGTEIWVVFKPCNFRGERESTDNKQ